MRVALAQLNPVVGDIDANAARVADAIARGAEAGAGLTLVPELALTGYPPEDLLLRPGFSRASEAALHEVAAGVTHGAAVIGFAEWAGDCFNSAAVVADGRVHAVYRKRFLPNYGVFDEARYFQRGRETVMVEVLGVRVALAICEDVWYPTSAALDLMAARPDLLAVISASPYHRGKGDRREGMLATRAADIGAALAFCNQVGGQDELVFDGRSALFDAGGEVVARGGQFVEDLVVADVETSATHRRRLREPLARALDGERPTAPTPVPATAPAPASRPAAGVVPPLGPEAEVWAALRVGLRDYLTKNRFPGAVVGVSGGIDSAVTLALAVDAIGPDRVLAVALPSRFTSAESGEGARTQAESLGVRLVEIPISAPVDALGEAVAEVIAGAERGITEENLQARARGTLLMAISNALGHLVLATGNKSEMSVGYSTLYGDMVGGFAPLRDVSKTWVYRLAEWRNSEEGRELIPRRVIDRAPTAELRPDQLDTDSLPPYADLDPILEGYVERDMTPAELATAGYDPEVVDRVVRLVDRAEYKRRQGPVGIKITSRALGKDRRMPITVRLSEGAP